MPRLPLPLLLLLALVACGDEATQTVAEGQGPSPKLPPARQCWFPPSTSRRPPAGRRARRRRPAAGLQRHRLRRRPRPSALALRAAERRRAGGRDQRARPSRTTATASSGWIAAQAAWTGPAPARRAPTASPCCATPTATASPRRRRRFLAGLHSPFGMALVGDDLYVADTDALLRFPYHAGETQITARRTQGRRPAGAADQPSLDQERHRQPRRPLALCHRRLQQQRRRERLRGRDGRAPRSGRSTPRPARTAIFASGLRNPVGMAWEPQTGALWTAVNERDELGSDLVPDYMTSVKDGAFYGWPYSYYGQHVDTRVKPQRPDLVATAIAPDYALGAHTASLGLAFAPTRAACRRAFTRRRLRRPARLLEPQAPQRLPGGLRAVRRRQAGRQAGRRADRLPRRRRQRAGPPGGRRARPATARCWSPTTSATRSGG